MSEEFRPSEVMGAIWNLKALLGISHPSLSPNSRLNTTTCWHIGFPRVIEAKISRMLETMQSGQRFDM
jgi:hypothetical protein